MKRYVTAAVLVSACLMAGASPGFAQTVVKSAATVTSAKAAPATTSSRQDPHQKVAECCQAKSLSAAAWDVMAADIQNDRESHRASALAALAVIGDRQDTVSLLQAALRDKRPAIRKDAALALGDLKVRSAIPELRVLLDDNSPDVGYAAADALWKMDDHSGRHILIATLGGERRGDGFVKGSMKSAYQRYTDPKQLAWMGASEAAGSMFGPASIGISFAREYMKDHTAAARANSASLLGKDSSPDAIHQLTLALSDKSWAVRAAAAEALAKSPGQVSPEVLEPLLIDDSLQVRDMAAAAIIRLSHAPKPKDLRWPTPSPVQEAAKR